MLDNRYFIIVLGAFLNIFKPGALLAPLGKICYGLNSKWPTSL